MRSWYLFQRFVKHVRQHVGDLAETIIQALSDLLPIKAELSEGASENDDDDISSTENNQTANAQFDSQLYLYESIGCISSARSIPPETQVLLIKSVINPLCTDLEVHLVRAKSVDKQSTLQVHHLIMALGTLARGFADGTPANNLAAASAPPNVISEEFSRAAEAVLMALEALRSVFEVREAARFAFNRFIAVVGSRILPQLPRWIDGLLSDTSTKDEMAMFMKLLDQVVFGFKSEIFDVLNTLLTPFLQRVFSGITEPVVGTDDEIQLTELKREYLGFLLVVLNNGLESVFVSESKFGDHKHRYSLLTESRQSTDILDRNIDHRAFCQRHLGLSNRKIGFLGTDSDGAYLGWSRIRCSSKRRRARSSSTSSKIAWIRRFHDNYLLTFVLGGAK